jgi:hypothetical protein
MNRLRLSYFANPPPLATLGLEMNLLLLCFNDPKCTNCVLEARGLSLVGPELAPLTSYPLSKRLANVHESASQFRLEMSTPCVWRCLGRCFQSFRTISFEMYMSTARLVGNIGMVRSIARGRCINDSPPSLQVQASRVAPRTACDYLPAAGTTQPKSAHPEILDKRTQEKHPTAQPRSYNLEQHPLSPTPFSPVYSLLLLSSW